MGAPGNRFSFMKPCLMIKLHFFADEIWSINNIEYLMDNAEEKHKCTFFYQLKNMISGVHFDIFFSEEKDEFVLEKVWKDNVSSLPDL